MDQLFKISQHDDAEKPSLDAPRYVEDDIIDPTITGIPGQATARANTAYSGKMKIEDVDSVESI